MIADRVDPLVGGVREPPFRDRATTGRRWPLWCWLIPLLLFTFWLGARGLDADAVWWDEFWTINDAGGMTDSGRTLADIWQGVAQRNPWHAPGFFMVVNGWAHGVGWEGAALRTLPLFLGLMAVAWTYRLGRDLVSPRVGLFAAAALGTSALFAFYLHELRMYTQITLLSVFTIWVYLRIVSRARPARWFHWGGLLVGAVGLLYTHYYGVIPLLVIGLYHLLFAPKNRRWWIVVGLMAVAGLLFLPWVAVLLNGINRVEEGTGAPATPMTTARVLVSVVEQFGNGTLILFGLAAVAAVGARRKGSRAIWFYAVAGLLLFGGIQLALQLKHTERLRYSSFAWPLLALVVGLGLARLWRWRGIGRYAALGLLIAWAALGLWQTSAGTGAGDLNQAPVNPYPTHLLLRALRPLVQTQDLTASFIDTEGIDYGTGVVTSLQVTGFFLDHLPGDFYAPRVPGDEAFAAENDYFHSLLEGRQRLWVVAMPGREPDAFQRLQASLPDRYTMCQPAFDGADFRADQYALSEVCCLNEQRLSAAQFRFGDGVVLADVGMARVEDALQISALWSLAADVPPHVYSISWQLLNSAGDKVGQIDQGLDALPHPCQQAVLPVADLPPGDYRLMATVYAWQTGERLTGIVTATGESGDLLPISTIMLS